MAGEGFDRLADLLSQLLTELQQKTEPANTQVTRLVDSVGDSAMDDVNNAARVNVVAGSAGGTEFNEDSGHTSGAAGTLALVVRQDADASLVGTDLDYAPLQVNSSGALKVTGGGGGTQYVEDDAAAANPTGTQPVLVRQDTPATLVSLNGDVVAQRGTNYGAAYTQVVTSAGAFVDTFGGGTQYTEGDIDATITGTAAMMEVAANTLQPVQGTVADGLLVNLGANNDVGLNAGTNNIGDVDVLTIAAGDNNIGNVDVVTLPALVAGTANIGDVDVLTVPAPLSTTGGGTEATALRVTLATDSTGLVSVDDNAGSLTVDLVNQDDYDTGVGTDLMDMVGVAVAASGGHAAITGDVTNGLDVDVTRLPALVAGTANIGDVDVLTLPALVAGTANIGDVDVLTVPAPLSTTGGGTEATALRVTVASDSTGVLSVDDNAGSLTVDQGAAGTAWEVVGDVAADAAAAGNPVRLGATAETMDDAAPSTRVSADADLAPLASDRDGALYVHPHGPQTWQYHENSSSALTDTEVHASAGAGLSLYVTDVVVSTGAATAMNIFFEEGAATRLGPWYLEAVAGRGLAIHFNTPKKMTAATALTVTTSAAIAHSIEVQGFIAPG